MLKLINFQFSYPDSQPLFQDINLDISTNKLTLLCGSNGAGKTTLCRILSGLEKGYKGTIEINEMNLRKASIKDISKHLIYLKQEPMANVVSTTPFEDLDIWLNKFSAKIDNSELIEKALKEFSVSELKESHIWELSSGQIKRVGLAAVSLFPNKFWILDEPTSGLDTALISKFIELLKKRTDQGLGTMIVTHRTELFEDMNPDIIQIKDEDLTIL